jgi:hypothetical protein
MSQGGSGGGGTSMIARKLFSRPPRRKRSDRGPPGSEGVCREDPFPVLPGVNRTERARILPVYRSIVDRSMRQLPYSTVQCVLDIPLLR